jgi:hypothetical protein
LKIHFNIIPHLRLRLRSVYFPKASPIETFYAPLLISIRVRAT